MDEAESRVEVYVTTDPAEMPPHKAGEPKLWVMYDAAKPGAGKLYFTEAEWDAFVAGVRDGEFDLDAEGNLPPVPADQRLDKAAQADHRRGTTVGTGILLHRTLASLPGIVPVVIVVAGVANVEVSVPVDGFPLAYAPVCYPQGRTRVRVAGVGFNVAAALAELGTPVRLATFVGADPLGAVVEGELRVRGLRGPWAVAGEETPRSVVLSEPGGQRMIHTDLRGLPQAVYPAEAFAEALRGAGWAVVTNIGFARPLLAVARAAGVPVAADVQAIGGIDDGYNRDWMAAARVLFCSHERLPCPPEAWVRLLWDRYETPVAVVGCGAAGAVLGVRAGGDIRRVPAVAPRGVVSTAGAGDALAAAFMHVYARTGDPYAAIGQAVLFAGHAVGAAAGESDFLTGPQLAELAQAAPRSE